ncbi:Ribonuclease P protein component [Rosistilla oblonga]|uniref:ribonuclease P protein component n=1 Tax=Rosistilla oblonga TaxID=2527990 RepID=UPI00118AB9EC|nr:ribonuclease P protein component [Rosistilla oblonga]QDV11401.1 Ribonuclease P protein component [Rosistilla oblonga]
MIDQRFPKTLRLKTPEQFGRIIRKGRVATDRTLVLNAMSNGMDFSRIGITIPKKTGNAVVRNRWKRLIREAFRTQKDQLPQGFDFVVRPRRGAVADHAAIRKSLVSVAWRATGQRRGDDAKRKPDPKP